MTTPGATRSYRNGRKNNWRRAVWNEVLRRTASRERSEVILYLPGARDLDREVATSKGVPHQNLIAVDRHEANVRAVRAGGSFAICADVLDVLWAWPDHVPVCAVLLDLTSGITADTVALFDPFQRRPLRDAVVMVNMLRGRDAWSNERRSLLRSTSLDTLASRVLNTESGNRAAQLLILDAWGMLDSLAHFADTGETVVVDRRTIHYPSASGIHAIAGFVRLRCPWLFSYHSGRLVFDTVIVEPYAFVNNSGAPDDWLDDDMTAITARWHRADVRRRIAAMLAIRTRRARA